MIDAALVRKVRNRAITYSSLFVLSAAAVLVAVVLHDGSQVAKFAGFFGALGVIIFWLTSGSEIESYKRARNGEAPYAE